MFLVLSIQYRIKRYSMIIVDLLHQLKPYETLLAPIDGVHYKL